MSTRACIHFLDNDEELAVTGQPIIYNHCDGYPSGLGADLLAFLDEVEAQCPNDTRFNDPEYLAAKWVVYKAGGYSRGTPLSFTSVGICSADHGDIAFRYVVRCGRSGRPRIFVQIATAGELMEVLPGEDLEALERKMRGDDE